MKIGDLVRVSRNATFAGVEEWVGRLGIIKEISNDAATFPLTVTMLDSGDTVFLACHEVDLAKGTPDEDR